MGVLDLLLCVAEVAQVDLGDDKERFENLKKMYKKTVSWWQDFLKAESTDDPTKWMNVQEVRLTQRLADAPVALITSQWGYSAKMENAYASQGQDITMSASKTLELNPDHPVIHEIWKKIEADPEDKAARETAELMTKRGVDVNVEVTQIEPEVEPEPEPEKDAAVDDEDEEGADDEDEADE